MGSSGKNNQATTGVDMAQELAPALFVYGGWEGHAPAESADIIVPALEEAGLTVHTEQSLEVYADVDYLRQHSVIVQNWTMGEILPDELRGLTAAVTSGVGFAGWHGGIADSFRMATDYLQMVGGQFAAHPHDSVDYTVELTPGVEHPITAVLSDFAVHSEQYWVLTDSLCEVLATTTIPVRDGDPWAQPVVSPTVWTRQWGSGRVFVNTVGHSLADLVVPEVQQLIVRGVTWAARGL